MHYKDVNSLYLGCNNAFESRLGLKKEKLLRRSAYDLFPRALLHELRFVDSFLVGGFLGDLPLCVQLLEMLVHGLHAD